MLLNGLASTILVVVEGYQTLWLCAIVESLLDNGRDNRLVVCEVYARSLQLLVEGELLDILQESVDAFAALVVVHELKQLLKHTSRSTRRRYELDNLELVRNGLVVLHSLVALLLGQADDAILGRSGLHYLE